MMNGRLQPCQEFIQSVDDGRSLLDSVATGDETWCFQYDIIHIKEEENLNSPINMSSFGF
jgi:hypothetical protein